MVHSCLVLYWKNVTFSFFFYFYAMLPVISYYLPPVESPKLPFDSALPLLGIYAREVKPYVHRKPVHKYWWQPMSEIAGPNGVFLSWLGAVSSHACAAWYSTKGTRRLPQRSLELPVYFPPLQIPATSAFPNSCLCPSLRKTGCVWAPPSHTAICKLHLGSTLDVPRLNLLISLLSEMTGQCCLAPGVTNH